MSVAFTLNGKAITLDSDPDMPLLWATARSSAYTEQSMDAVSRNAAPALSILRAKRRARA